MAGAVFSVVRFYEIEEGRDGRGESEWRAR